MGRTRTTQEIRDRVYTNLYGHEPRANWYPHQCYCTPKRKAMVKETEAAKSRKSFDEVWEESERKDRLLKEIRKAYV